MALTSRNYRDFSYWFDNIITDPNGNVVSDINAGITKLIPDMFYTLNDTTNYHKRFGLTEQTQNMPDIAAMSLYGTEALWWYIMFANLIDNPFSNFTNEFLYYAFSEKLLSEHSISEENKASENTENKIGTIIELN